VSVPRRIALVALAGVVAGALARFTDPTGTTSSLVFLSTCIVLGMVLVLRLENGTTLPLSYAVYLVVASSFSASRFAAAIAGAELIFLVLRFSDHPARWRIQPVLVRIAVAAVTIAVYSAVRSLTDYRESVAAVLACLGAAAAAQIPTDLSARRVLRLQSSFSDRARLAWLAIASSGVLMAIGYRGVDGKGDFGIWGALLFATPLLATWYAFERLDSAMRAYQQTIEALAKAPEFGHLVPEGHSQRVATLSVDMAAELGVSASDTGDLKTAALLHHLGQVTMDEPEDGASAVRASEVAAVTAEMLRKIKPLAGAGDIVAGEAVAPRRRLAVQILRVASDYDDLTAGDGNDPAMAIETLRSAPGYVYDVKVLAALEHVSSRRRDVEADAADSFA
jgi:hypothetical protein